MEKVTLSNKIYSKKMLNKINAKLLLLGDDCKYSAKKFLNYRTIGTLLIFILLLLFSKRGYLYAPICAFSYYYFITYALITQPIKQRTILLEEEAIFFFEILQLTLESGKTLSQALELTAQNIDGELSKEFIKTLNEVKLGKSLIESLKAMKDRIPSDTINNTILNITESSIFGSNIIESLNNQLEYLRNKRIMDIKGRISKLPTKISVLSVLFFIPIMLLIILAPVVIDLIIK